MVYFHLGKLCLSVFRAYPKILLFLGLILSLSIESYAIKRVINPNSDFSNGTNNWNTDYNWNNSISNNGTYRTVQNPSWANGALNSFWDHTDGDSGGSMIIANGHTSNNRYIWEYSATVTAGQEYTLTFWYRDPYGVNPGTLAWFVDGVQVGTSVSPVTNEWRQLTVTFIPTTSGYVTFGIRETTQGGSGNVFALDDVTIEEEVPPTCNGKFYDSGGTGGEYSNNERNTWVFCGGPGQNVRADFNYLRIYNTWDYLIVTQDDGSQTTYTSYSSAPDITSTGNCLSFYFYSSTIYTDDGWDADISCVDDPGCDEITELRINDLSGGNDIDITSGGTIYTNFMPSNWNLQAITSGNGSVEFEISGDASGSGIDNSSSYNYPSSGGLNLGPGTYTITATYYKNNNATGTECDQVEIELIISDCDASSFGISSNEPICSGQDLNLTANSLGPGTTYSWVGPNGFTSNQQNPTISNASVNAQGNYTCTVDQSGCTASATLSVDVDQSPTASIGLIDNASCGLADGEITINFPNTSGRSAIEFSINGGGNYPYNVPDNSGSTTITGLAADTYDIWVRWGNNECPIDLPDATIINETGTMTMSSSPTVCAGNSANISASLDNASGSVNYSWSNGIGGGASKVVSPSVTTVYSVTGTDATGCTATGTVSVNVNPLPNPSISGNSPVCLGGTIDLTANGGSSYSWTGPGLSATPGNNLVISDASFSEEGNYIVNVTDANGCQATANTFVDVEITVFPTADIDVNNICVGQNLQLRATGGTSYQWSGPNGFTSSSQDPQINTVSLSAAGTYTVTAFTASGCYGTATVEAFITQPNVTASNTSPVCTGQAVDFSASGGTSYSWSGPNGFSSTQQNPRINPANIPAAEGTYTVTAQVTPTCSYTATTSVSLYSLPNVSVSNSGPVCSGDPITLNSSGGTSYSWVGPNGFSSLAQNPVVNNMNESKSGIYSVTVTNAVGCTASATTEVALSFPTLSVSPDTALCAGGDINLWAEGSLTYSWAGPNGFSSYDQYPSITNAQTADQGEYYVTVMNSLGCSATATINVTVLDVNQNISSNGPICFGEQLEFSYPGWDNYTWSGPNSFSSSVDENIIYNATTASSGVYTVTASVNGCTTTATSNITVNALPSINLVANSPTCFGENLNLSAEGGGNYVWTGPQSFSSSSSDPVRLISNTNMAGQYKVEVTSPQGCIDSAAINVSVSVINPTASNSGAACFADEVNLFASGGNTYSWVGPDGFNSSQQNPIVTNLTSAKEGVYTVTVTNSDGCTGTATTEIYISTPPLTVNSNSAICEGGQLNLTATGGVSYEWEGPSSYTSSIQNPTIYNTQLNMAGYFSVTVTDSIGCRVTDSVEVVVNALAPATASNDSPVCAGEVIQLNSSSGVAHSWSGPGFASNTQNINFTSLNASQSGAYTVTITDINGCTNTATTNVTIHNNPVAVANTPIADVCITDNIDLNASGGVSYTWSGPDGFSSTNQNPSITGATLSNTGVYSVTVYNVEGCVSSATVQVTVHTPPGPPTMPAQVTRCDTGPITLEATGCAGTISWYSTNSSTTVLGTGSTYTTGILSIGNNGSETNRFYASCKEYSCPESNRAYTDVEVLPPPTATSTVSGTHCKGSTALFTGGGNNVASYSWAGPNGFSSNLQSPKHLVSHQNYGGAYTLTTTRSNGCTATSSVNLTVINNCNNICNDKFYIVPTNPTSCNNNNGAITIWAENNMEYTLDLNSWTRGNDPYYQQSTGLGVGEYFYYVRDYSSQYICKNVTISLESANNIPNGDISVTNASDCYAENGSIQINGLNSSDQISWLETLESNTTPVSSLSPANTITDLTAGTYYVRVTGNDPYCFDDAYVTVPSNSGSCSSSVTCSGATDNLFPNGDFGSGAAENGPPLTETQYGYSNYTCFAPWDGFYSLTNNTDCDGNGGQTFQTTQAYGWWQVLQEDHTPGDTDGYMMVVNAGYDPNIVIEKNITGLCPNTRYNFTAWLRNISPDSPIKPDIAFIIDGVIQYTTGDVTETGWVEIGFSFKTGDDASEALFALRNIQGGGFGNNFIVDDISVSKCPLDIDLSGTTVACLGGLSEDINATITDPYSEHTYYRWEKSDDGGATWDSVSTIIEGTYSGNEMEVSLTLPTPVPASLTGRIYRIRLATTEATVDDPNCSVYTSLTQIVVPPIEVSVSEDQEVCVGDGEITLSASPDGGSAPYSFEWSTGETTASIDVSPDATTTYYLTVRDADLCPAYDTVTVDVSTQPSLTIEISPDSVCLGGEAWIEAVVAGGSGNFEYTWYTTLDTNGSWTELSGDTTSLYNPSTAFSGGRYYRVFVEDLVFDCTDALSNAVYFVVVEDPIIEVTGQDAVVCLDGVHTLSPTITGGTGNLSYQWQYSTTSGSGYVDLTNDTLSTYTPVTDALGTTFYRLIVTSDGNGCLYPPSDEMSVEVLPNFDVEVLVEDLEVCPGGATTLTADTISGSGTVTYQWFDSSDGVSFSPISGETSDVLNITTSLPGTEYYRLEATSSGAGCGTAVSDNATVEVLEEFGVEIAISDEIVCRNANVTLVADTLNGSGNVTFQWQNSIDGGTTFNDIGGEVNPTLNASTATPGTYLFRVIATADGPGCGSAVSDTLELTVLPQFSIDVSPASFLVCAGGEVVIDSDTSSSRGTVTYQWYSSTTSGTGFAPISGANADTLSVDTSVPGIRYYRIFATASGDGCGTAISDEVEVEVLPVFEVNVLYPDNEVCIDGAVELNAQTISGSGTITYQWYSSTDGVNFAALTDSTDTSIVPNTSSESLTYYRVNATATGDGCGTAISDTATVNVLPVFDVDVTVNNALVCIDGFVELVADTISGTGTIGYQWYSSSSFGGPFSPIAGETDSSYTASTSNDGITYYQVRATASGAGCGTADSDVATVEVLPEFSVDVSPDNSTICLGGTVEIDANVSNGTGTITYQWYQSTNLNGTYTAISGATDSILSVTPADSITYYYYVEATASGPGCGTVSSDTAVVDVLPNFEVNVSLLDNVVCLGANVVLTSDTTSGFGPVIYEWYSSTDGTSFSIISDSSNATLYPPTNSEGIIYYRLEATSSGEGCGMSISDMARVEVLPVFDVDVSVNNDVVCIGGDVELVADTVNGTGNISYQWFSSANFSGPFTAITGETDSLYIPTTSTDTTIYYQVQATADGLGCGTATSDVATVEVLPVFSVEVNPVSSLICLGGTVEIRADTSNGTGDVTYQWYYSTNAGGPFQLMAGETDSVLTLTPSAEGIYYYYIEATASGSGCGTVVSEVASVEVLPNFDVEVIVNNAMVCTGGEVVLEADTISGSGTISYQWQYASDGISFADITDSTDISLVPSTNDTGTHYYRVIATASGNGCGTATSEIAVVDVEPQVSIDIVPSDLLVCEGEAVVFEANPQDGIGPYTFQWQSYDGSSWIDITGETDTLFNPSSTGSGVFSYRVNADAQGVGCDEAESSSYTLTILELPDVTVSYSDPLCEPGNGEVIFTFNDEANRDSIQFSLDGVNFDISVSDAIGSLTIDTLTDGNYTLEARWDGALCPVDLGNVTLIEHPAPNAALTYVDPTCTEDNGSITFTFNDEPTRTQLEFSWDGGVTYQPAVNDDLGTITYNNFAPGTYDLLVRWENDECPVDLGSITMIDHPSPVVSINEDTTICAGVTVNLVASAVGGDAPITYTWDNGLSNGNTNAVTPMVTTTYIVTATDTNACFDRDTVTITVNDLPAVAATGGEFCEGDTLILTARGGTTYTWTGPAAYSESGQSVSRINTIPSHSGTYTVQVLDGNGCANTDTAAVTVNPAPSSPNISDQFLCGPGEITFSASGCSGGSLSWFNSSNLDNPIGFGTTFVTDSLNATSFYYVSCTDANNCENVQRSRGVAEIRELSNAEVIPINTTCAGANALNNGVLLVNGFRSGETYSFSQGTSYNSATAIPASPGLIPEDGEIYEDVNNPSGAVENYTVRIFSLDGCPTDHTVEFQRQCDVCFPYCEPAQIQKVR
ncbi:Ig-like domain-containing protein [Jiulongibacter sp. NS-SX5]|uniref:Ig-like domain-containing protein n=1 Tax=Jiulongibacter sp. NS-SX5 TaxID=3463854 RepID=UPI0040589DE2